MTDGGDLWKAHLACYAEADGLYRAGRLRLALATFQGALALAPGDVDTLWAIADCYSELRLPRKAEAYYRKARARAEWTNRGDLMYNIANALLDQGRPEAALKLFGLVSPKSRSFAMAKKNCRLARNLLVNMAVNSDALRRPGAARLPAASRRLRLR